jgi:succinyl-CoA synthetase alpha subunit
VDARNANLTFIKLDGNVGCIVNGAGLGDGDDGPGEVLRRRAGELPRHRRLVEPEKVVNALRIITADPNVKAILFNIFGGITRTDDVANGIVTATKQNPLKVPIVIRLTGTNEEIAVKILEENGFTALTDMDEAVKKAVQLGDGGWQVSVFIDKDTRLIVQGITGRDGSFHAKQMLEYGTNVVAGVTPGKGGQKFETTVPVFNTVEDAVRETGANTTVIYVPPPFAADAMMEAASAGVKFIVCITEACRSSTC